MNDQELIIASKSGDSKAFKIWVKKYHNRVSRTKTKRKEQIMRLLTLLKMCLLSNLKDLKKVVLINDQDCFDYIYN